MSKVLLKDVADIQFGWDYYNRDNVDVPSGSLIFTQTPIYEDGKFVASVVTTKIELLQTEVGYSSIIVTASKPHLLNAYALFLSRVGISALVADCEFGDKNTEHLKELLNTLEIDIPSDVKQNKLKQEVEGEFTRLILNASEHLVDEVRL